MTGTTFTVDSTGDGADSNASDGVCDEGNGNCTLRAAIQEANRVDGSLIEFDISGGGTRTIRPASALPTITRTVFIDGFSQSGASSTNYRIELDGTNSGINTNGLTISGTETWVRGLAINRFDGKGLVLQGSGKQLIEENRIGTSAAGNVALGNGDAGISISSAPNVVLQNNLISGNESHGISISGSGASNAEIYNNIIGANASGTADLGNGGSGIDISGGSDTGISVNLISGNDSHGISLRGSRVKQTGIWDNLIGTTQGGNSGLGNTGSGVHIGESANFNVVAENTIAHNSGDGITVVSNGSSDNSLQQNFIYSNGGLGLDLGDDGVTANDDGDGDSGPNSLQNFPVLKAVALREAGASIAFELDVVGGTRYVVDLYASNSCDVSGKGEGREWVGLVSAQSAASGKHTFRTSTYQDSIVGYQFPTGTFITATATATVLKGTSEFSSCVERTVLPELVASVETFEVTEDDTKIYTLALSQLPASDITVNLTTNDGTIATVMPSTLTFTTTNGTTPQDVTVTGVSDSDPVDEATSILHTVTIDGYNLPAELLPVRVVDDDVPDVALVIDGTHRVTGFVSLLEFQSAAYPVVLTEEPADDVTVSVYSSSSSALRVLPSSLTFTKDEYDMPQEVTITALVDSDAADELVSVYHEVEVDGVDYVLARVRAFIRDPIFPALTLSTPTFRVNEGETATYTIVPEAEPSRSFTLTLESSDAESVTVSPPTMTFTVGTNGNWETEQTATVTAVQDDDEFDDSATILHLSTYLGVEYRLGSGVEVTVADGNRAPFFEEGAKISRTVPENSPQGTNVGEPVVATDLNGDTLTYTIGDQIGGPYEVDNSGQITVGAGADLDYESRTTHEVKLTVQDTEGLSDTIDVQIEITDVNEPPVLTGSVDLEFAENRTGSIARYSASDPERDTFTWSVGGADESFFSIDSRGYLSFIDPPDFEASRGNIYNLTVVATDTGGMAGELGVKITVTNVNEPPTVAGRDSLSVEENNDAFSERYFASDLEGNGTTFTWSISGTDVGDFNISQDGDLTFRNTPDYETPSDANRDNEYLVTVVATDEGSLRASLDVTVTVNDVNEAPEFTSSSESRTSFTYQENSTSAIYTYQATDPEGGAITWSVSGTDGGDFDINSSGVLTFRNAPDFENPVDANRDNEYLVTVQARDDGFNLARLEVMVNVTNSTGPLEPTITTTGRPALTYQENGTGAVYSYRATDPQRGTITWSLNGDDAADFLISGSGDLTFRNPPDFENPTDRDRDNVYEITVVATDEQGLTDSFDVAITVTNHAESVEPTISTRRPPSTYRENDTATVYNFRASDPQRGPIAWSHTGTDASAFDISAIGALTFRNPPDFEAPRDVGGGNDYELTVVATDEDGHSDRLAFTITVTDVNEGPEISLVGNAPGSVPENQDQMQVLARYRATDPEEPGTPITRWSASGTDGGDFVMNEQGELRFRYMPDYERPADSNQDNIYNFSVRASDGRYYGYHEVTVTVTPVNEAPAITTTSVSATGLRQSENRTSRLYTYRATDPEGSAITWSVGGIDGRFFTINERGEFSFNETRPPDYEMPADSGGDNVYDLTVQARDADFNTGTLEVTVTVTDVNEGPEVTSGGDSFNVQENRQWSGATFTAVDPEQGTVTRWSLGGRDGSDFTISENGVMTFRRVPDYERPDDSDQNNVYEVEIRPYDGRYYGSHDVTVTVGDVNEITGPATLDRAENFGGVLAIYRATGQGDLIAVPAWRLTGTDGGDFTISEEGELTFRAVPDHERPADSNRDNEYLFTVQASDDRYYGTLEVTVTVSPVNEPPTITTTSSSATELRQVENRTSRLYSYRATDPEGGSTIRWSVGGVDNRFFAINEHGEFSFATTSSPDFEQPGDAGRDNVYNVTVQVSDDSSPPNTASLPVTVTVTDVNEGPEITSGGTRFTVPENQDWAGASFTASDPEGEAISRWNLGGRDGGDFTISETGLLTFRSIPDYERPVDSDRNNIYEVEVRPYDGRYYGSHHVTVTVTPINEAPDITTASTSATSLSQPENRTTRLYTYRATDPESRTVSWSMAGTDGRFFTIDEMGQFSFKEESSPNFEIPSDAGRDNVYDVTVQASDGTLSGTLTVTVTVTDANEGPQVTSGGDTFIVQENSEWSGASFTAADPEGDAVTRWNLGGRDGGDFSISEDGVMTFRNIPDYERPADSNGDNIYEVEVRPYDGRYYGSHDVTVTVTPINEVPEITTTSTSATALRQPENRTLRLYTYRATDPEGSTLTWSVAGTDRRFFTIDERGQFSFKEENSPNFEQPGDSGRDNIYDVAVLASDGTLSESLAVTVTVTDANEGPQVTSGGDTFIVQENSEWSGAGFGASDPEGGAVTRWNLGGRDGGDFTISETGVMTFRNIPDYERPADSNQDNVYEVEVRPYDGRYYGSHPVTVTVEDVNEISGSPTISHPESSEGILATYSAGGRGDLIVEPSWRTDGHR